MISFSRTRCKQKRPSPMRESTMLPARFDTAFANLLLAASSGWALYKTGIQPCHSAITFSGLLLHAIVGIMRFGNPKYGDLLRSAYENSAFLCIIFALPCLVAQFATLYNMNQEQEYLVPLFVLATAVTAWHYISHLCSKEKNSIGEARWAMSKRVRLIVLYSLVMLVHISYQKLNYYGFAAAWAFCQSFFITGTTGIVFNIPALDLFLFQMTFFNIFAVKALLD